MFHLVRKATRRRCSLTLHVVGNWGAGWTVRPRFENWDELGDDLNCALVLIISR